MKNLRLLPSVALTCLALAAAPAALAQSANLLGTGDFESLAGQVAAGSSQTVAAGSALGSWTVGAGGVTLLNNSLSIAGISTMLSGDGGRGALTQAFAATAGTTYRLQFDYIAEGVFSGMDVTLGGIVTPYYGTGSAIQHISLDWTASQTGSTLLGFTNYGKDRVIIDGVQLSAISAVPEPESYALLLAGLGAVGFIAGRRRRI